MKVPLNWLKEYVEIPKDEKVFADKLTAIGHMQDHPPQEVAGDLVLDLEVRQNRSDCLSMWGIAREAGAILKKPVKIPALPELPKLTAQPQVTIKNDQLCYRFQALQFEGIKIKPSPEWLVQKLEAYGVKAINNLVDITNFVMIEVGEPLHAFDITKVADGKLIVRNAERGESLTVIGNKKVNLDPADLVIADAKKILALGGVIGGSETAIQDSTTAIILEAATYNQANIRRTTLRHSLRTEASLRHEKFLHPSLTDVALARAAQLILDLCDAKLVGHTDAFPKKFAEKAVTIDTDHVTQLSGIEVPMTEIIEILNSLGIQAKKTTSTKIQTQIPYFRTDLEQEADLIEEILRIHGYDKIPEQLPTQPSPKDIQSASYIIEEKVRDILVACGFDEQITEPLTREENPSLPAIYLQNSLNADKVMLRTTLKNILLQVTQYQRKVKKDTIQLFEAGKIYFMEGKTYQEKKVIGGIMSGREVDFLRVKGITEIIFERVCAKYTPELVKIEHLTQESIPTYYFEVDTAGLINQQKFGQEPTIFTSFLQVILQDMSITCPPETKVGELLETVKKADELVYKVELGEQPRIVDESTKTVFLHIQYHNPKKTLSNDEVTPIREKILTLLKKKYGADLR